MREIKFRAWAVASNIMFYPNTEDGWDIVNGELDPLPNTILMQYTGLKDKNGKDIYEGDIIKAEDKYIGVVKYSEVNAMYFISGSWFSQNLGTWEPGFLEIIGNEYEHPKSLEEI